MYMYVLRIRQRCISVFRFIFNSVPNLVAAFEKNWLVYPFPTWELVCVRGVLSQYGSGVPMGAFNPMLLLYNLSTGPTSILLRCKKCRRCTYTHRNGEIKFVDEVLAHPASTAKILPSV